MVSPRVPPIILSYLLRISYVTIPDNYVSYVYILTDTYLLRKSFTYGFRDTSGQTDLGDLHPPGGKSVSSGGKSMRGIMEIL